MATYNPIKLKVFSDSSGTETGRGLTEQYEKWFEDKMAEGITINVEGTDIASNNYRAFMAVSYREYTQ